MKTSVYKVKRSGAYYLMTTITPENESRSAKSDIWGAVVVVVLLLGAAAMMRLILSA